MRCPKCGCEISDGSKFCTGCGNALNGKEEEQRGSSRAGIYVLSVLLVLVLGLIAFFSVLIIRKVRGTKEAWKEDQAGSRQDEAERHAGHEGDEKEEDGSEEDLFASGDLLVTVPSEYMSLRTTPGLGEDVISRLPAGEYLLWAGETATVQERDFYKVMTQEGRETGYVAADYCVLVDYRDDPELLTVVDVTEALYTYDIMQGDIRTLCNTYPDRISYEVVGYSRDGREICEVTLGNSNAVHHIFVQAAIHGREYMTAQLVMKMLEYYAANYHTGSYHGRAYEELFENTAVHVIPMSNPDGVTISQIGVDAINREEAAGLVYECYLRDLEDLVSEEDANGDQNWADYYKQEGYDREAEGKTEIISFEEYQHLWKSNADGVDLNNNFDAGWEEMQVKPERAYGSYKGDYAVSEPETQILVAEATKREYDYFISYHAKGQLIYYDAAGNDRQTSARSYELASSLGNLVKYKPVNTQKGYNVNLGGFSDWVQLKLHGASVTVEIGKHPCPLQAGEFNGIWHRNRESWAMLCEKLYDS